MQWGYRIYPLCVQKRKHIVIEATIQTNTKRATYREEGEVAY
jgi:hypothetical protein